MGKIIYLEKPRLKKPKAVAGLPGIANVGKLAADFMIHKFKAKKFAEIVSEHLPEWGLPDEGDIRTVNIDFYYCMPRNSDFHLILITSDAQATSPVGQYVLSGEILDLLEKESVETLGTMAAYVKGSGESVRSQVVGTATSKKMINLLKEKGIEILTGGVIVGMNGLLPALAALRGIEGFCLLGVTAGGLIDPVASNNVIAAMASILGFKIDSSELLEQLSV
ncbi:MAG: PAC2 family protein, partial [Candidatus Hadarchaeales archaeon]